MQCYFRSFIRQAHYRKYVMIKQTKNCFLTEHFLTSALASHKCLPIKLFSKYNLKVNKLSGMYLNHKFGHHKQTVNGRLDLHRSQFTLQCFCSEKYSKLTHTNHDAFVTENTCSNQAIFFIDK